MCMKKKKENINCKPFRTKSEDENYLKTNEMLYQGLANISIVALHAKWFLDILLCTKQNAVF